MASAADMNHALPNKLIELQGWTLVLLLCFSCLLGGVNSQELPEEEMDALQALKRAWNTSTPDFQTTFETWNSSRPCGDLNSTTDGGGWRGVTCDVNSTWPNGVTVTKLSLKEMGIVGVLPSDVSKLINVEYIDLASNQGLFGPIPKGLVQLQNLTELGLGYNMFSGEFPFRSIINGSKLQKLDISSNQLNGTIEEDAFWNLRQLVTLDLSCNGFRGQVLDISKIKKLQSLDLASNKFTGQAPNLSNLITLKYLNISRNKFKGQIPTLSNLTSMNKLDLSQNNFTGQTPDVSKMKYLYTLNLSRNGFTGQTPDVSNLNELKWLNMSWNKFTGHVPKLSDLSGLNHLDLSQNNFTGYLPKFSSNATDLTHINLSSNHFTELSSDLWPFLSKLPKNLTVLDLSSLRFGGGGGLYSTNLSFPVSLSEIYLDKNKFIGPLNVSAILESNMSQALKVASLKDNMITDIIGHESTIISFAIGLTKIELRGNPYCKRTWTSQAQTTTCNFYCANTCFKPKQPKKDRSILIMATSISTAVVVLVVFLVVVGFVFVLRRKQKYIQDLQKKIKEADVNAKKFDYHKLRVATKNFAPEMKLGEGGFGAVYKGILASNDVVAVKQLLLNTDASREDFVNEVLLISNLQHQNLVALKGYCLNDRQTFLVYEYVDNCDLDKLLLRCQATPKSTSQGLQLWKTRLKICQGVAHGLHYLHTFSHSRIIHRDIKASNILVNENFEAKIADFGLARLIAGSVIETDRCAGTYGYLAPEYATQGQLSEKADVFSFGVLLLEIVSGMRNRDHRLPEDETHLAAWACNLHRKNRLFDMKDPTIIVSEDEAEEVQRVLETAVLCVQNDPKKRPAMILVAALLVGKANGDELPQIDEELNYLPGKLASEESYCDSNPLFVSSASAPASLASRLACDPQIELSASKNGRLK